MGYSKVATPSATAEKQEEIDTPKEKEQTSPPSATLGELFQFSDGIDLFFIFWGVTGAIASGFCQPAFCLLFGVALDDLNGGSISTSINKLVVWLIILGIGNWIVLTIATGSWGITGERQAQKMTEKYVSAVLSQEIGWFDTVGANQIATKLADMSGQLRDGMTYKLCDLIQYISQVLGCVIVGLALDPYVALIMFACESHRFYIRFILSIIFFLFIFKVHHLLEELQRFGLEPSHKQPKTVALSTQQQVD